MVSNEIEQRKKLKPKSIYRAFACGSNKLDVGDYDGGYQAATQSSSSSSSSTSKRKLSRLSSTRESLRKLWKRKAYGGSKEEAGWLLAKKNNSKEEILGQDDVSCNSRKESIKIESDIEESNEVKKKGLMKRAGKVALRTIKYIGIGLESLSPGMPPHVYTPSGMGRFQHPGYPFDSPYNEYNTSYSPSSYYSASLFFY